jgi:Zn-dependent metalloprotease
MKKSRVILALILFSSALEIYSQNENFGFTQYRDSIGWYYFGEDTLLTFTTDSLFITYKDSFNLTQYDTIKIVSSDLDTENLIRHTVFKQYYKGYLVEGAEFVSHGQNNIIDVAHGKLVPGLDIDVSSALTISEDSALTRALNYLDWEQYAWEDDSLEFYYKEIEEDSTATYYPMGELLIAKGINDSTMNSENYHFVWKFSIKGAVPFRKLAVYVDAKTGDVVDTFENCYRDNWEYEQGTCATLYNGGRTIETYHQISRWLLMSSIFWTHTMNTTHVWDWNNNWVDNWQKPMVSAHWAAQQAFDYFYNVHRRYSWDGIGGKRLHIYVNVFDDRHQIAASNWDGDINIDDRYGVSSTTLDIVAHEFAHGNTFNLIGDYSKSTTWETGALIESFCDIFGELTEKYTLGNTDWIHGNDHPSNEYCKRNFQYPHQSGNLGGIGKQPDSHFGSYWVYRGNDIDEFTHINSGVINKWFYLLAQGGLGINNIVVTGLGISNSEKLLYYTIKSHLLDNNCNFYDARNATIFAASILFGPCSDEVRQVRNAWGAVGVLSPDNGSVCLCLFGPTSYWGLWWQQKNANNQLDINYYALTSPTASSYDWTFPTGWSGSKAGNHAVIKHTNDAKTRTIKVRATINGNDYYASKTLRFNSSPWGPYVILPLSQKQTINKTSLINEIKVYPSPAKDFITIKTFGNNSIYDITIIDISGKVILKTKISEPISEVNISGLLSGVYLLKALSNDNTTTIKFNVIK